MKSVTFRLVNRRIDPNDKRIRVPAYQGVPLTSSAYDPNGDIMEPVTYSQPGMNRMSQRLVNNTVMNVMVDRSIVGFNTTGDLTVVGNPDLEKFMRNHDRCQGSWANKRSQKQPLWFEYNPEAIASTKATQTMAMAEMLIQIKNLRDGDLFSWCLAFGFPVNRKQWSNQDKDKAREWLVNDLRDNPEKYLQSDMRDMAGIITEIKEGVKYGALSYYSSKRQWRWGKKAMNKDESLDVLLYDLVDGEDKDQGFAAFLNADKAKLEKLRAFTAEFKADLENF